MVSNHCRGFEHRVSCNRPIVAPAAGRGTIPSSMTQLDFAARCGCPLLTQLEFCGALWMSASGQIVLINALEGANEQY